MDEQKALEVLSAYWRYGGTEEFFEALSVAIAVLKKSMPKSPHGKKIVEFETTIGMCPNCGEFLSSKIGRHSYCEFCGQCIDWYAEDFVGKTTVSMEHYCEKCKKFDPFTHYVDGNKMVVCKNKVKCKELFEYLCKISRNICADETEGE